MKAPETNNFKNLKSNGLVWTLVCGFAGLIVLGVWVNGSHKQPAKSNNMPASAFTTGQASFMESSPDSGSFSVYGDLSDPVEAEDQREYVPPPPDELFGSSEGPSDSEGMIPEFFETNLKRQNKQSEPASGSSRQRELYQEALASGFSSESPQSQQPSFNSSQLDSYEQDIQRYRRKAQALNNRNPYQQPPAGRNFEHSDHQPISGEFTHPQTPYTLMEGTLIPAVLQTRINSQLPGNITAMINRDIYDSIKQKYLLIPRGTRLIGSYDERIVLNQSKIMLSWERMIFPDGRSISLPDLNTHDLQGTSGLAGKVKNHFWKIFGQSAMLSLIGAGANAAAPQEVAFGQQQSVAQATAEQIAQDFNRVSTQVLQRNLMMAPEIKIPYAQKFNIFLAGDISFAEPYQNQYPE